MVLLLFFNLEWVYLLSLPVGHKGEVYWNYKHYGSNWGEKKKKKKNKTFWKALVTPRYLKALRELVLSASWSLTVTQYLENGWQGAFYCYRWGLLVLFQSLSRFTILKNAAMGPRGWSGGKLKKDRVNTVKTDGKGFIPIPQEALYKDS